MATVTLTLEDINLDTGQYKMTTDVLGSQVDDGFMTGAQVTALYISHLINTPQFAADVWDFAQKLVAGTEAEIGNADMAPGNNGGPGSIAA